MTNTHTHNRGGMPSLAYGAAIAIATSLIIITVQHFLLASNEPSSTRMDMMLGRAKDNYLRSHPPHHFTNDFMPAQDLLQGPDGFFSPSTALTKDDQDDFLPSIWHDEFFSPLFDPPFTNEFRKQHHMTMFRPAFKMDEDGDQVSLVMSIPDVPLKDIYIEVIGGRLIHIKGEKTTANSHVSFDKKFSIGQHLNESNLKAKLTKDGDLVVTAPKVGTGEKSELRKIPITEEL